MWIGGYDDWTPAEQREWDRDLEELEREEREREVETEREQRESKDKNKLSWMDLALDDPLYKATYTKIEGPDWYVVDLKEETPSQRGDRNLAFEVVYPLYEGLNAILEKRKDPRPLSSKYRSPPENMWASPIRVNAPLTPGLITQWMTSWKA